MLDWGEAIAFATAVYLNCFVKVLLTNSSRYATTLPGRVNVYPCRPHDKLEITGGLPPTVPDPSPLALGTPHDFSWHESAYVDESWCEGSEVCYASLKDESCTRLAVPQSRELPCHP